MRGPRESALRGSGCFKALNTPVTLTIQPTHWCCLFINAVLYVFRYYFFCIKTRVESSNSTLESLSFWRSEGGSGCAMGSLRGDDCIRYWRMFPV